MEFRIERHKVPEEVATKWIDNHLSQKVIQHKIKTYVAKDEFCRIRKDVPPPFSMVNYDLGEG